MSELNHFCSPAKPPKRFFANDYSPYTMLLNLQKLDVVSIIEGQG